MADGRCRIYICSRREPEAEFTSAVGVSRRQNLHGCNSPVMPNGLGSLRVYPDRSPSKVKARVNLADVTIQPYFRKFEDTRSSLNV